MAKQQVPTSSFPFRIAIDGPAGVGKSTLACALAKRLCFFHINTGMLYRAFSYALLETFKEEGVEKALDVFEREEEKANTLLEKFTPILENNSIFLDGEDISRYLRSHQIDSVVGIVAKHRSVRKRIGEIQREMIKKYSSIGIVVEGRDIGTVIIPDAELKIFLVANIKARAERRFLETQVKEIWEIEREMAKRDHMDQTREIGPLVKAPDSIVVDNSNLSIEETVDKIVSLVQNKIKEVEEEIKKRR